MKNYSYSGLLSNFIKILPFYIIAFSSLALAQTTIFLKPQDINKRGGLRILTSGTYAFTDDVFFTQINNTAITIAVDDVILDLNDKTLRASNPSGENIGINITGPNRKNITIRNGKIANFNVFSVTVDSGSTTITLENLGIISSSIRGATALTPTGIALQGTLLSPIRTTDVVINNCTVNNSRFGLRARATDGVRITNSTFNSNGSRGISGFDCNLWEIVNCQAANQKVSDELGNFGLISAGCSFWRVKNCDFSFNRIASVAGAIFPSVGGAQFQALLDTDGITILQGSGSHIIEDCTFCNNTASVPLVIGRGLALVFSNSCVVRNCIANGNVSIDTLQAGFLDFFSTGNLYENCIADGNYAQAAGVQVFGFVAGASIGTCFVNCMAKRNSDLAGGLVIGFLIDVDSSNCLVQNCQAIANTDVGFWNLSATSAFTGNLAFGNPFNYVSTGGPLGFITVVNGVQPPSGTFDERQIDNISIV